MSWNSSFHFFFFCSEFPLPVPAFAAFTEDQGINYRETVLPCLILTPPPVCTRQVSAPPCPGVKSQRSAGRTTFPRVHREAESSNQRSPGGAISVEGVAVRPVNMALFPAFAGLSEASGGGPSRKGKHPKRVERDDRYY